MFSNSFQSGFISIFYSVGSNPLSLWDKQVKNGHIRRVIDDEVKSLVLEISGTNVATTYITCPIKPRASLGIKLPFLVMIIKNMKKYFTFEIQILDDKDMHRRFRVSNFQSTTKVRPFCTTMPIGLSSGWNQVQFNLADFTKRAYGSTYLETMRVQIHANVRIRRLYFTDTLYSDEDMPNEFKLFGPVTQKKKQTEQKPSKEQGKEQVPPLVTPKTLESKTTEEIPPPPSPAEISPGKEINVTDEEQVHASEAEEVPPLQVSETTEGVEGAEEVPAESDNQQVYHEEEAPAENQQESEITEEVTPQESPVATEEGGTADKPIEDSTEEQPQPEEPATNDTFQQVVVTETNEHTTEVTTTEVATSEPTTSELPTESENESPEE
ncbi:cilia- and flagella-associated protein 20 isoform X1 [Leptinotarsa decemlineata]|uniref:cilia- and flagella-associated protein 20 isoform X1 n=1 Tax=Leptinotarsa decemlineata TaxID=7539 RepID=UPI003D307FD2